MKMDKNGYDLDQANQKIAELERELHQQRFNNKNNLSIDQVISEKIKYLEEYKSYYDRIFAKSIVIPTNEYGDMLNKIQELENRLNTANKLLARFVPDPRTIQWDQREIDARDYLAKEQK